MRLVTFALSEDIRNPRIGALRDDTVIDLEAARSWGQGMRGLPPESLPGSMFELIQGGQTMLRYAANLVNVLEGEEPQQLLGADRSPVGYPHSQVILYPPLMRPMSLRDFYAFEQHVKTAFQNRGQEIPKEWYEFPVFYYSNPNAIFGPDEVVPYPAYTQQLDYELEIACIIGKAGIDIPAGKAEEYIYGYTILNDWSARDIQRAEMRVGLGPAKGKDFATSLGPWIATPDELADKSTGRPGIYNLTMKARINGQERSSGNWTDMYYSFGDLIARASQSTYLYPGDVIGSGTVGTGCLLELTKGQGPWLQPGDVVELEVEGLGVLRNQVQRRK